MGTNDKTIALDLIAFNLATFFPCDKIVALLLQRRL